MLENCLNHVQVILRLHECTCVIFAEAHITITLRKLAIILRVLKFVNRTLATHEDHINHMILFSEF